MLPQLASPLWNITVRGWVTVILRSERAGGQTLDCTSVPASYDAVGGVVVIQRLTATVDQVALIGTGMFVYFNDEQERLIAVPMLMAPARERRRDNE